MHERGLPNVVCAGTILCFRKKCQRTYAAYIHGTIICKFTMLIKLFAINAVYAHFLIIIAFVEGVSADIIIREPVPK